MMHPLTQACVHPHNNTRPPLMPIRSRVWVSRERGDALFGEIMPITHGMSDTRYYAVWRGMKARCQNPKSLWFKRYGGRGIKVCRRWNKFENFVADMGEKPTGMSLDRIDNDGNYEPSNCRWTNQRTQCRNTAYNKMITINGITKCLIEWCEEFKMSSHLVGERILYGWTPERALHTKKGAYTRIAKHLAGGKKRRKK